ncbi:hypothetical protein, partial [Burkholderia sp. ABCPW 14]|uniref:hypothetical protein n=1 Tax=Burkholderia sp. ABCPW 14 TaxID=1637860 RepID=UPI001E32D7BE
MTRSNKKAIANFNDRKTAHSEADRIKAGGGLRLLRITESMTTDFLPVRYTVITLNGGSVDGQNGRSYAQAGACW